MVFLGLLANIGGGMVVDFSGLSIKNIKKHIDILQKHCKTLEIGVLPYIGTANEGLMFKNTIKNNEDALIKWAKAKNATEDAQIYIRPVPADSHPWLFLDDVPKKTALAISEKYASVVVETSENNCQIRLLADVNLTVAERSTIQKILAPKINADSGSTAGDKWGRLAGFKNRKPKKKGWWTRLVADTTQVNPTFNSLLYSPLTIQAKEEKENEKEKGGVCVPAVSHLSAGNNNWSESEKEFGWATNRIRWFRTHRPNELSSELIKITAELIASATSRKKRNPTDYAERTIRAALLKS